MTLTDTTQAADTASFSEWSIDELTDRAACLSAALYRERLSRAAAISRATTSRAAWLDLPETLATIQHTTNLLTAAAADVQAEVARRLKIA